MRNSTGINTTWLSGAFELRANNRIFHATFPRHRSTREDPVQAVKYTCCLCCKRCSQDCKWFLRFDSQFVSHGNKMILIDTMSRYSKCHTDCQRKHVRWIQLRKKAKVQPSAYCSLYNVYCSNFCVDWLIFFFFVCGTMGTELLFSSASSQRSHRVLRGSH